MAILDFSLRTPLAGSFFFRQAAITPAFTPALPYGPCDFPLFVLLSTRLTGNRLRAFVCAYAFACAVSKHFESVLWVGAPGVFWVNSAD